MVNIFISYSKYDKEYTDQIVSFLTPQERIGKIRSWYDGQIQYGDHWKEQIEKKLRESQIVLLLISNNFIKSDFCYKTEMEIALDREKNGLCTVIPIFLSRGDYLGLPFMYLQGVPEVDRPIDDWPNKDQVYTNIASKVRDIIDTKYAIPELNSIAVLQTRNHNIPSRFFNELIGREKDLKRIMEGLENRFPIIMIVGFQGIGKTALAIQTAHLAMGLSFIQGLIPTTFDLTVWISAMNRPMQTFWLNDILNSIAKVSGNNYIAGKSHEMIEWKKEEINRILNSRKVLVIIDGFETIHEVELLDWLYSVPEPTKILITSRRIIPTMFVFQIDLKGLSVYPALSFIGSIAHALGFSSLEQQVKELQLTVGKEMQLFDIKEGEQNPLLQLIRYTYGSPKALELSIGLLNGGPWNLTELISQMQNSNERRSLNIVFDQLHRYSWTNISEESKSTFKSFAIFEGISSITVEAVRGVVRLNDDFDRSLQDLLQWKLIERDEKGGLIIHPITFEFAKSRLLEDAAFETVARQNWLHYYRILLNDVKSEPKDVAYWNSLVTNRMKKIDPEWPAISQVLKWLSDNNYNRELVEFSMLLVHYMDSRLLNRERIYYLSKASAAANNLNMYYEEALLRIDGLGWTYIEENMLADAEAEIIKGLTRVEYIPDAHPEGKTLVSLARTWLARIAMYKNDYNGATTLIKEAFSWLRQWYPPEGKPWIRFRLYMTEGDINFNENKYKEAIVDYTNAIAECKDYESEQYQIEPRIGFAYIGLQQYAEAKAIFGRLKLQLEPIAIGRLYAELGLALITYYEDKNVPDIAKRVSWINDELSRRSNSNVLFKLIEALTKTLPI